MLPTQILSDEHRVIEQVLDCLEALGLESVRAGRIDVDAAKKTLEVLSTFADKCHHGKEEDLLFPAMERRGFPRHVGPMAVMLHEHEIGRAAIRDMRAALDLAASNAAEAASKFQLAAGGYVELLREHIAKEDGVLFPLAESILREEDRAELLASYEKFEHADLGAGVHERMLALADELADRFHVPKGAARPSMPSGGGCCGHHGHCHG